MRPSQDDRRPGGVAPQVTRRLREAAALAVLLTTVLTGVGLAQEKGTPTLPGRSCQTPPLPEWSDQED